MDADITSTSANITFEGSPLLIIEKRAAGGQKYNRFIACQVSISEDRGILAIIYTHLVLGSKLSNSRDAIFDGCMTIASRFRKNKDHPSASRQCCSLPSL